MEVREGTPGLYRLGARRCSMFTTFASTRVHAPANSSCPYTNLFGSKKVKKRRERGVGADSGKGIICLEGRFASARGKQALFAV